MCLPIVTKRLNYMISHELVNNPCAHGSITDRRKRSRTHDSTLFIIYLYLFNAVKPGRWPSFRDIVMNYHLLDYLFKQL
jgi:hypothetical protein